LQQALQAHREGVQLLRQLAKKMQVAAVAAVCGGKLGVLGCRLPPPHPWLQHALPQQQLVMMVQQDVSHSTTSAPPHTPPPASTGAPVGCCGDSGVTGDVDIGAHEVRGSAAGGSRHPVLLWQPVGPLAPLLQELPSYVSVPIAAAAVPIGNQQVPDTFADVCLAAVLHQQQQEDLPSASGGCASAAGSSSSSSCGGSGCRLVMVPAHSVVLSSRCTYFEALLSSRWQQEQPPELHQAPTHAPAAGACAEPASSAGDPCAARGVQVDAVDRVAEEGSSGELQHRRMRLLVVPGADAATLTTLQRWLYTGQLEHRLLPSVVAGSLQHQERCSCAPAHVHKERQVEEQRAAGAPSSEAADEDAAAACVPGSGRRDKEQQQSCDLEGPSTAACSNGAPTLEVAGNALEQPADLDEQCAHLPQDTEEWPVLEGAVLAPCVSCAPATTFLRLWQVCDLLLLPQLQQQCAAAVAAELQQLPGRCLVTLLRLALEVGAAPAAEEVLARLQQLHGPAEDTAAVTGGWAAAVRAAAGRTLQDIA
jgi:hypothetical protein